MMLGEVLAIGDELIHGALLDTNSKYLAGQLEALGVVVQRFTVVSDDPAQLREDDNEFEFDSDQPARGRKLN